MPLFVIEATRAHITVQSGVKIVTVWGEILGKSPGLPDYQIYGDQIKAWDEPNEGEHFTPDEKRAILAEVCDYLRSKGRNPVVLSDDGRGAGGTNRTNPPPN
jgi:hypothetical protein